jgi:hypothetical protein
MGGAPVNEVACVFRPLVDEVRARGIPPERLLHGLPLALDELGNPRRRMGWDDFVELARRVSEIFGPDAFEELAARSAESALPASLRWLLSGAGAGNVRRAYRTGARFWGPRVFRATRGACELLPDGRLREVIEILPPYRESPEFFRGVRGLLRRMPRLFGQPDAIVELECDGRRGEFLIQPVSDAGLPRPRLLERLESWARGGGTEARSVERLARALAHERSRHQLPRVALRVLQHELGVRGAALARDHPALRAHEPIAESGDRSGRPASVRPLHFAQQRVGWLALWTPRGDALGDDAERSLRALHPALAFLMDSVRVAEENQHLTELLESSVHDWQQVQNVLERIVRSGEDEEPSLGSTIPRSGGTLLLIEDDELVRRRVRKQLEAEGHAVATAGSDLSDLPAADPVRAPIHFVVADWANVDLEPESLRRIARVHPELRGVLLVRLRP